MAHFQSGRQTDEYGNPIRQTTDECGNPIIMHRTGGGGGGGGVGADLKDTVKDLIPGLHGHNQTDEYGNPIQHRTGFAGTGTGYGTGVGTGPPTYGGEVGAELKDTMKDMVPGLHGHDHQAHRQTTDEYGNPMHHIGHAHGTGTGLGGGVVGAGAPPTYGGGRVGTDLKETVKEKVPGLHGHDQAHHHVTPTTTSTEGEGHHEKKGIMEKIKEKLPGHHH